MSHEDDISFLDKPEILQIIFPVVYSPFYFQMAGGHSSPDTTMRFIEVEEGIKIGCGFWVKGKEYPAVLYFHGNGETVGDYGWLAQRYFEIGVNLFVADYRGYGVSSGKPTVTNLLHDCHAIFKRFQKILEEEGHSADYFVMGRSLGSIPAVEMAYHYQGQFRGLVIESGSASNFHRLWTHLEASEREKQAGGKFLNQEKIKEILIPTCIIHGEYDEIIPVQEGYELYQNSGAASKDILVIPGAGHNDLMMTGHDQYFGKIESFVKKNLSP